MANKLKTILIKGKPYVQVSERVTEFHRLYPNGKITTEIISKDENSVIMRAIVWPDVKSEVRFFDGFAHEDKTNPNSMVNKTSHIENCQTSAIGRALGFLGIGSVDSIASADEVLNAMIKSGEIKPDVPTRTSDTTEITVPTCSVCQKAMFKGRFGWYCPDYKQHKADKVKSEPVFAKSAKPTRKKTQPF